MGPNTGDCNRKTCGPIRGPIMTHMCSLLRLEILGIWVPYDWVQSGPAWHFETILILIGNLPTFLQERTCFQDFEILRFRPSSSLSSQHTFLPWDPPCPRFLGSFQIDVLLAMGDVLSLESSLSSRCFLLANYLTIL